MELVSAGLGANGVSNVWECSSGLFNLHLVGTFGSETATLEMSPTAKAGTFSDFAVRDGAGTVAALTFAASESIVVAGAGQYFRITMSAGAADVDVYVSAFNQNSVVKVHQPAP